MAIATKPDIRPANPNFSSGPCSKRPGFSVSALAAATLDTPSLAGWLTLCGADAAIGAAARRSAVEAAIAAVMASAAACCSGLSTGASATTSSGAAASLKKPAACHSGR